MNIIQTKKLPEVNLNEGDLNNIAIINPTSFISKEDNEKIIESLKQSIKDFKDPDKWMTWEESNRILTKRYFGENV